MLIVDTDLLCSRYEGTKGDGVWDGAEMDLGWSFGWGRDAVWDGVWDGVWHGVEQDGKSQRMV